MQVPHRHLDLPAAVALSWSLASGMLFGGAAVAVMLLTSQLSGHLLLTASATLFTLGAALGFVHGGILGVLGRPEHMSPRQAVGAMVHGLFYLVPGLLVGWLVAGWVAALPIALHGHPIAAVISAVAWAGMAVTVYFAGSAGLHAAQLAYRRWPDRVPGTLLIGVTLAALLLRFAVRLPTVWFTSVHVTYVGAGVLALTATCWFYGPIIVVGLALRRKLRWEMQKLTMGLALGLGCGLAVLAVPFHAGALGLPTTAEQLGFLPAAQLAVTTALTDELVLRFFLLTVVLAFAARYAVASWWALGVVVVIDVLVHLSAIRLLGLPGPAITLAYLVVVIALPAAVYGYLYWRRGLGTAVMTHAVAGIMIGVI